MANITVALKGRTFTATPLGKGDERFLSLSLGDGVTVYFQGFGAQNVEDARALAAVLLAAAEQLEQEPVSA